MKFSFESFTDEELSWIIDEITKGEPYYVQDFIDAAFKELAKRKGLKSFI